MLWNTIGSSSAASFSCGGVTGDIEQTVSLPLRTDLLSMSISSSDDTQDQDESEGGGLWESGGSMIFTWVDLSIRTSPIFWPIWMNRCISAVSIAPFTILLNRCWDLNMKDSRLSETSLKPERGKSWAVLGFMVIMLDVVPLPTPKVTPMLLTEITRCVNDIIRLMKSPCKSVTNSRTRRWSNGGTTPGRVGYVMVSVLNSQRPDEPEVDSEDLEDTSDKDMAD